MGMGSIQEQLMVNVVIPDTITYIFRGELATLYVTQLFSVFNLLANGTRGCICSPSCTGSHSDTLVEWDTANDMIHP